LISPRWGSDLDVRGIKLFTTGAFAALNDALTYRNGIGALPGGGRDNPKLQAATFSGLAAMEAAFWKQAAMQPRAMIFEATKSSR
jgi:hypothetical protein